jgi:hypothetical protein
MIFDLSVHAIVGWIVIPALVFSAAYDAILTRLSLGIVPPYGKANVRKRLIAGILDMFVFGSAANAAFAFDSAAYLALAAMYVLLRDAVRGQSLGKFMMGLVVMNIEDGKPATLKDTIRRNALFLLPGANLAAVVLETRTLVRDSHGQRLGDRFAQTQVVEGAGAAELARSFADRLLMFVDQLRRTARQTHGDVGRRDRAA